MSLAANLDQVSLQISQASAAAGRQPAGVQLIAVSKTVDAAAILAMYNVGQRDFAESRPQALRDKALELVANNINWHFIGSLQTNKIKYVYPVAALVHSIDRRELLEEFSGWQQKTGRKCPVLLQVHISREAAKQGFACDEVLDVIREYRQSPHLDIRGMMGMAPFDAQEPLIRACFRELADLFAASRELAGPAYRAEHLSMGMSGDFKIAIAEGATMVRIGTALFAGENNR